MKEYFLRLIQRRTSISLLTACLLMITGFGFSQTIKGKITDETNESIPGASVIFKGTSTGITSDLDGAYTLKAANAGTFTIQISFVGYKTIEREITLADGQTEQIDISLNQT